MSLDVEIAVFGARVMSVSLRASGSCELDCRATVYCFRRLFWTLRLRGLDETRESRPVLPLWNAVSPPPMKRRPAHTWYTCGSRSL